VIIITHKVGYLNRPIIPVFGIKSTVPGSNVIILEIYWPKISAKNFALFTQITAIYAEKKLVTLVIKKVAISSAEKSGPKSPKKWPKSPKIVAQTAENCD
jgi:hypothetical protein